MKTNSEPLRRQGLMGGNHFMETLRDIAVETGAWILSAGFLTGLVWIAAIIF